MLFWNSEFGDGSGEQDRTWESPASPVLAVGWLGWMQPQRAAFFQGWPFSRCLNLSHGWDSHTGHGGAQGSLQSTLKVSCKKNTCFAKVPFVRSPICLRKSKYKEAVTKCKCSSLTDLWFLGCIWFILLIPLSRTVEASQDGNQREKESN